MAGKKPPQPLGEKARSTRPDRPPPPPAEGETASTAPKPDEHLRQRLEAALAAAGAGAATQKDTPVDLRSRLQAALGPSDDDGTAAPPSETAPAMPAARPGQSAQPQPAAIQPAVIQPAEIQPAQPQPAEIQSPRTRVAMLVAGLLLIGGIGVVLIRSVGQEPEAPGRLSTTSAQPAAPVPVRAGSSYVATEVQADGTVSVSHWVRPRTPAFELTLSLPQVPAGGSMRASGVHVDVDGTSIPGPSSIDARPHTYVLPGGRQILVTYRLSGTVERSPSVEGRALVRVASLDLSVEDVHTRTQAVEGVEILSMACTANRQRALPEPCGEPVGERWEVRLTGPDLDDRVMAQVELG